MTVVKPMLDLRVDRIIQEAIDIVVIDLVHVEGRDLPPFSAGSHIDLDLGMGLVRQYSLCNSSAERNRYTVAVLRDPASRGGSIAVHNLRPGQIVRASEPRNLFELSHAATRSILFAGGIGVTPILCMADRLQAIGADFAMHYAARSPDRAAFRERIVASSLADRVAFHFDDGPAEQKLDMVRALAGPVEGTHLYVCGPGGFIDFVLAAAAHRGFPAAQVHREYFGAIATGEIGENEAFDIVLASSGETLHVPADKTVLDILFDHGIDLASSCGEGICGSCVTRVIDGIPDHRDLCLMDEDHERNDVFTPCCSRARTPTLTLDL